MAVLLLGAAGCSHTQSSVVATPAVAASTTTASTAGAATTVGAAAGATKLVAAATQPPVAATPQGLMPQAQPNSVDIPQWARGAVIHRVPVRASDKVFALTFDDGPWPKSTHQILQILAENNIKATFFMVGHEVRARPEVARAVRDGGHAIGNHSWDHPSRPRDPVAQIQRTDAVIQKELGFRPTLFRPPYGIIKNGMAAQAEKEGDAVLIWSADCADWKRPGVGSIASMIISQASPGGIALMHDGGGDRSQTVAALPRIISELRGRGYRFVTIPELLRLRYIDPHAPKATAKTSAHKARHAKKAHKKHR